MYSNHSSDPRRPDKEHRSVSILYVILSLVIPTTPALDPIENLQSLKRFALFFQWRFPLSREHEACMRHECSYVQIQAKNRQQRLSGAHTRRRPDIRLHEHFGNDFEYVWSTYEGNMNSRCRLSAPDLKNTRVIFVFQFKWAAWCAMFCSCISFANSKASDDNKQIFSSFMWV